MRPDACFETVPTSATPHVTWISGTPHVTWIEDGYPGRWESYAIYDRKLSAAEVQRLEERMEDQCHPYSYLWVPALIVIALAFAAVALDMAGSRRE